MKAKNLNLQPTALLAELVGTFILAIVAITVANPIIVGFTLVVIVLAIGAISGAHVNPAVTFGLWSIRKLEGIKVPFYIAMQLAGALLALLVTQFYQGGDYGISFASFNSFDGKIMLAELFGAGVFTFAIAAAVQRNLADSAKALCIGLALLTGLAVGGGLLGQAVQNVNMSADDKEPPRVTKIDGAVLNPAIALAATEKAQQQSSMQSLTGEQNSKETKRPASRLTWETLLGALIGGAVGMNLFMLTAGAPVAPLKKKETATAKVTKVFKKGKKK
jgi:aquaporin Z